MQYLEGSTEFINGFLCQLFLGHTIQTTVQEKKVTFPTNPGFWVNGALFAFSESIVQLDVRLGGFDQDRVLIESIAGFGPDRNAQARFALERLANASFHVFLPAFFDQPPCHGTERETWIIGGRPRNVYAGPITAIFSFPPPKPDGIPDLDFYPAFIEELEDCPLPLGTHWIRISQMRHNGQIQCNEVLLDNENWEAMENFMAGFPWPRSEQLYDVRVFLIIKDA